MFKVGDRVVVVKNKLGGPDTFFGQRGVVKELSDEHFGVGVHTESYGMASFYPDELEFADEPPKSKFSVGDRVVVVGLGEEENGRRCVVTSTDAHEDWPIEVRFDENGFSLGLCSEDELELEERYDVLSALGAFEVSSVDSKVDTRDDLVNHPSHYADGWSNGAEVIDITEHLNFNRGNAVKYLSRAGKKGGPEKELEDLQKALWYVTREVQRLGGTV